MPRSPFTSRLSERRSSGAMLREKAVLISRQRVAKSASPGGSVQIACRCSGSITMALIVNGKEYLCEGIINGTIISTKKGTNGFGYDPIFVPDGYSKTFAELDFKEKSTISHRALALQKIMTVLNNLG